MSMPNNPASVPPVPGDGLPPTVPPVSLTSLASDVRPFYLAVGLIGLMMPWTVRITGFFGECITSHRTVSSYYYTGSRDLFVGSLVTIGILILASRIGNKLEQGLFACAAVGALMIGLCPMEPDFPRNIMNAVTLNGSNAAAIYGASVYVPSGPLYFPGTRIVLHGIGVGLLFGAGFVMTMFVFPRNRIVGNVAPDLRPLRKAMYYGCGVVMAVSWLTILYLNGTKDPNLASNVFYPESFAITAFALAFLVKSQVLLKNTPAGVFTVGKAARSLVMALALPLILFTLGLALTANFVGIRTWGLGILNPTCEGQFKKMPFGASPTVVSPWREAKPVNPGQR